MINKQRLLQEFIKMAMIPSPSGKEKKLADYLMGALEDLGLEVEIDKAGEMVSGDAGNIIATLKGSKQFTPIIFCAHMDTVEPCDQIRPLVTEDRLCTNGSTILSADDKAGIAAIIEALRVIVENGLPHGDIQVLLTICEETGMHGSKNLDTGKLKGEYCFILDCDGPPGTIVIQGPAKDILKALILGKRAHAGLCPQEGISAIQVGSEAISEMHLLRIDDETTANIGLFHGACPTNVVCDRVEIIAEARSLNDLRLDRQTNHMEECFRKAAAKYGAGLEITRERSYAAFQLNENDQVVAIVKKAAANIGLSPVLSSTGGGSDANVLNSRGIPAVDLGIGMARVHSTQEYILQKDLINTTRLVLEIINLCKK